MNKLTKDDFYELEKTCDILAGISAGELNKLCSTAIHIDALKGVKEINVLHDCILEQKKAYDRFRELSNKLKEIRLK